MPENPVKETIEALYKPIESIVKTLAGPAAEEIGLSFRDSVQVWRFKRQVRLFERVKKFCEDTGIKPEAVKLSFLFDVVERASLEEDNELQDRWAALLANAADPKRRESSISSAFPNILGQLSKEEAVFLEKFYKRKRDRAKELSRMKRLGIDIKPSDISPIHLDNLLRLKLLDWPEVEQMSYGKKMEIYPTAFGGAFVDACTSPKKKEADENK